MDQKQKARDPSDLASGAKSERAKELERNRAGQVGGPGGLGQPHPPQAQRPLSEQASHQGGGQIRSDHKLQSPGAGHDPGPMRKL